jgi:hypothetical protein
MQSEKIKLFNRELLLTERKAFDVYEIEEYMRNSHTTLQILYGDALFVQAGLKYNIEDLCIKIFLFGNEIKLPFRPFRYLKLKRILSADYLLKNLTRNQILELVSKIWYLETGEDISKKKVLKIPNQEEKESAENMLQHS